MSARLQEIEDAAYARAVQVVRKEGAASVAILQEKARASYNGAHEFLRRMQVENIIGPADESGNHQLLT